MPGLEIDLGANLPGFPLIWNWTLGRKDAPALETPVAATYYPFGAPWGDPILIFADDRQASAFRLGPWG